eukprot:gb/GFBE01024593.1/.p1 GENE.gb/GFBE01024593.1/~~gb/GFBE01024593.1/.p1  ORF type:complete len:469 (+),score=77.70 gb/GFBE01024593.1/:1-1407(+)
MQLPSVAVAYVACICASWPAASASAVESDGVISARDLRDKIEGYWVGQLVGNFMGLPFETCYGGVYSANCPDQTPPGTMPFLPDHYYSETDAGDLNLNKWCRRVPQHMVELNGSYSDDDTDIEFVTLHAVEEHGLNISYAQIADEWQQHVNGWIWIANRRARDLMEEGLLPPATGSKANNSFWYAIDPQLVNEIWSAFYPGMLELAVARADWGAHVTSDDWGTHPTRFYAALYSAAFFETNVSRLYDIAMDFVPRSSPFYQGLQDVRDWHATEATWRDTWQLVKSGYINVTMGGDYMFSAVINGLMGATALLYGEGDFMRTVGIAIAAGFDCDNQAATLGGLIGVLHGSSQIPRHLTHEVGGNNWTEPFNDRYINERRDALPVNNSIRDIVDRVMQVAATAITANGGHNFTEGGDLKFHVNLSASLMGKVLDANPDYPTSRAPVAGHSSLMCTALCLLCMLASTSSRS